MTWKERRIVTALGTILAVLFAALLLVLSMRYQENRQTQQAPDGTVIEQPSNAVDRGLYTAVSYDNGTTSLSFSMNEAGIWRWNSDPDFPLNEETIVTLTETLTALDPRESTPRTGELSEFGLSTPFASLTATTDEGAELHIAFGKRTSDDTGCYALINHDDTTVHVLEASLLTLMETPIFDMMLLPELPALTEDILNYVSIQGQAVPAEEGQPPAEVLTVLLSATRAEGDPSTTWRFNGANVTDTPAVRDLLEMLSTLQFARCVIYRPSEDAADLCGFQNPTATLTVLYQNGEETGTLIFFIGDPLLDGSGRYVRLDGDDTIYMFTNEQLETVMDLSVNGL